MCERADSVHWAEAGPATPGPDFEQSRIIILPITKF